MTRHRSEFGSFFFSLNDTELMAPCIRDDTHKFEFLLEILNCEESMAP